MKDLAEPPDEELVGRAIRGDDDAFDSLVLRYHGRVRRLAFTFVRDAEAAEDVAQDSFLRAYRKLGSLGDPSAFKSWLFQIVANRSRDLLRQWAKRGDRGTMEEAEELPEEGAEDPVERLDRRDLARAVARIIQQLPEKSRVPLLMKESAEMTYAEIARTLDIPQGTAQIRVHRARLALRARLRASGLLSEED